MKKYFLSNWRILAVLLVVFSSCNKDVNHVEESTSNSFGQSKPIVDARTESIIQSLGYSTSSIGEYKDCYIVEGDILIPKAYLSTKILTKHYAWEDIISTQYQRTITVSIAPSVPESWRSEIKSAVNHWNSIGCKWNIRLNLITRSDLLPLRENELMIDYPDDYYFSDSWAGAYTASFIPPGRGVVGGGINIIPRATNTLSSSQKIYTIAHAMGHCLGFNHTDGGKSNILSYYITGTATNDPNSIMNMEKYPQRDWGMGFTEGDILAARLLYPNTIDPCAPDIKILGETTISSSMLKPKSPYNYRTINAGGEHKWTLFDMDSGSSMPISTPANSTELTLYLSSTRTNKTYRYRLNVIALDNAGRTTGTNTYITVDNYFLTPNSNGLPPVD